MVSNLHIPITHKFTFTITFLALFMVAALGVSLVPISSSNKSPYESGYDHGCDDSEAEDRYINELGKGASFHTDEFMDGYRTGYRECKEGNSNDSENDDELSSDCFDEGYNDGKDNPFSLEKYRDCGGSMGLGITHITTDSWQAVYL
jgi:hypothetical protein